MKSKDSCDLGQSTLPTNFIDSDLEIYIGRAKGVPDVRIGIHPQHTSLFVGIVLPESGSD